MAHFAASCFSFPLLGSKLRDFFVVVFFVCLWGFFGCLFLFVLVWGFFCFYLVLAPFSSAKAALQGLLSPFETHLVKGQQFCGTHTTSSTSSSGDVISAWLSRICCCLSHC